MAVGSKFGNKVQKAIDGVLDEGETVQLILMAQAKSGSGTKRLAKDIGISLAISAVTSLIGFGVMRNTMPPSVWVLVTPKRLLMLARPGDGRNSVGELVFDAPLEAVTIRNATVLLGTAVVDDAATGENIAKLNFGAMRKRGAQLADAHAVAAGLLAHHNLDRDPAGT